LGIEFQIFKPDTPVQKSAGGPTCYDAASPGIEVDNSDEQGWNEVDHSYR
jgi:hypothetical protein